MVTVRVQRCAPHILGKNGCCVYCGASASGSFVPYADASGAVQPSVDCEHITASHTSLNSSGLTGGWYAVKSDVTVSSRIKVKGSVNLILCDGATLTASEGITVPNGNSLTIWGQGGVYNVPTMTTVNTFGTGKLYAQPPDRLLPGRGFRR